MSISYPSSLELLTMWATAFSYGFAGSLHCVGMCGPLVLAIPFNRDNHLILLLQNILYNIGRITSYLLLGLIAGIFSDALSTSLLQKLFSLVSGLFLIFFALFKHLPLPLWSNNSLKKAMVFFLKKWQQERKFAYILAFGILNGLLPCSFAYGALIGALNTGYLWSAVGFMLFFGLGTIPAMFGMANFGNLLKKALAQKWKYLTNWIMALLGVLLILRSLGLLHH